MRLGFHMPLSGGANKQLNRAYVLGMETVQIFSGNPTTWRPSKIDPKERDKFIETQTKLNIRPLVFHTPYLINLASPKQDIRKKSIKLLQAALDKANYYKAPYVVTHIGSHVGEGRDKGIDLVVKAIENMINEWPEKVMLLIENTAGAGSNLGGDLKDLEDIMKLLAGFKMIGCCFDTAHAWGAGYDISYKAGIEKTLEEADKCIGLNNIKVCHANDSAVSLGSKKDLHANIGEGHIGLEGFKALLRHKDFSPEAVIMETPKIGTEWDKTNLLKLKEAVGRNEK